MDNRPLRIPGPDDERMRKFIEDVHQQYFSGTSARRMPPEAWQQYHIAFHDLRQHGWEVRPVTTIVLMPIDKPQDAPQGVNDSIPSSHSLKPV